MNRALSKNMLIMQRCKLFTENITLTILHQLGEWPKDELEEFSRQYTQKVRAYMSNDRKTLKDMADVLQETKIDLYKGMKRTCDLDEMVELLWRKCFAAALVVLRQCGSPQSLVNLRDYFEDWMISSQDRIRDEVDVMNDTMRFLGRKEITYEEDG